MKINEVITEAVNTATGTPNPNLLQRAIGGVKGAVQGYRASQQQRQGQTQAREAAKNWINKWNQAVGANPAMSNDPTALQNFAKQITSNKINVGTPADMSAKGVANYLTNVIGQYHASAVTGQTPTPATTAPATTMSRAQQIKQARAQRAQATPTPEPTPTPAPELSPGVTNVSAEPVMFKFQGQTFGLGSQGQWIYTKSRKPAPEELQAFLDQQHDKFLGLGK